jgi:hypothetical protein
MTAATDSSGMRRLGEDGGEGRARSDDARRWPSDGFLGATSRVVMKSEGDLEEEEMTSGIYTLSL